MVSKKDASGPSQGTEIQKVTDLPIDVVQGFTTPADIEAYFASQGLVLSFGEEISDGYEKLENKDRLVEQPFIIIDWRKVWSEENQADFYTIRLMTRSGEKFRMADGSSGIFRQLDDITSARANDSTKLPNAGLVVKNGLTKSEYWVSKMDGRPMNAQEIETTPAELRRKAATYYLNL